MKEIFIATANINKVKEFEMMLQPLGYQVKSLLDLSESINIVEDGDTFEANAYKKAKQVFDVLGQEVISDDSGFCVNALDGNPGVYSARFLGEDTSYEVKNTHILKEVEAAKNRGAQFVCVICHISKDGSHRFYKGVCEGEVAKKIEGKKGFGYDPIFYYPPLQTTLANVSEEQKNQVSHRGKALRLLMEGIRR